MKFIYKLIGILIISIINSINIGYTATMNYEKNFDLTTPNDKLIEESINISETTPIVILLTNKLPIANYTTLIQVEVIPIAPFKADTSIRSGAFSDCSSISESSILDKFKSIKNENNDLLSMISAIKNEIDNACENSDTRTFFREKLKEMTTKKITGNYFLRKGERLSIIITRHADEANNITEKKWNIIINNSKRGEWMVDYGFGFPIYSFNKPEEYFLKAKRDTSNIFIVTKQEINKTTDPIASVFFHWFPADDELSDFSQSITGGLGTDLQNLAIFLGYSLTYNKNISLSVGIVANKISILNSKYKLGEELTESTIELNDKVFRFNPFVAMTFRFEKNIF